MEIAALIGKVESGKITVSAIDGEVLEIKLANKKIDVNAESKDFLKHLVSSLREGSNGSMGKLNSGVIKSALNMLGSAKDAAEKLCEQGVTLTVSYKGDLLLTIGSGANPKLTKFIAGDAIEIKNLYKLIEMGIDIF
jgi:hypothetical protein